MEIEAVVRPLDSFKLHSPAPMLNGHSRAGEPGYASSVSRVGGAPKSEVSDSVRERCAREHVCLRKVCRRGGSSGISETSHICLRFTKIDERRNSRPGAELSMQVWATILTNTMVLPERDPSILGPGVQGLHWDAPSWRSFTASVQ